MSVRARLAAALLAAASFVASAACAQIGAPRARTIALEPIGRFVPGPPAEIFGRGAAEIAAHDPATQRLFVANGHARAVDVLDIRDPAAPRRLFSIDVSPWGARANSVAVSRGRVAVAVEGDARTDPGRVLFFDAGGALQRALRVGALPDMLAFTPDGRRLLVANEGEPSDDYRIDPEGSVSVVDVTGDAAALAQDDVATAHFRRFDATGVDPRIRVFGPGASPSRDLEPEFIAISPDSRTAWVTLQENDALAVIDVGRARVTRLLPLGAKDHRRARNALDASDRDGGIRIRPWPVHGLYQPDGIAAWASGGDVWLVTANEGDARDYAGFSEIARVEALPLDPQAFPDARALQRRDALGRLETSRVGGDADGDGDFDRLLAFGARSFAIWSADGALVFDSGAQLERITARRPALFNADEDANGSADTRSDDKGPEPEGVAVGRVAGRSYAFVGLERPGGVVVYDVSDPRAPRFVQYATTRDPDGDPETGTAGDLGPEGLLFIPAHESPAREPLLVVTHEVSGTTLLFRVRAAPAPTDRSR